MEQRPSFDDVMKHIRAIQGMARKWHINGMDADDITQHILLRIHKALPTYNADLSNLKSFIMFMEHRELCTLYKGSKRGRKINPTESYDELHSPSQHSDPLDVMIANEAYDRAKALMSPVELQAMNAVYLRGMTLQEYADELGVQLKYVDNAITRARKKFRLGGLNPPSDENAIAKRGHQLMVARYAQRSQRGPDRP